MTEKEKQIVELIRRAFWIDKKLPPVFKKYYADSLIGRYCILPDERNVNEILEELELYERPTHEDLKLWETVMFNWIPSLPDPTRQIIKMRGMGMGWKRISRMLIEKKVVDRILHRSTLWRMFKEGLMIISQKK